MPKPTKKQLASEARCKACDKGLWRLRSDTRLGPNECCCPDRCGYCMWHHKGKEENK